MPSERMFIAHGRFDRTATAAEIGVEHGGIVANFVGRAARDLLAEIQHLHLDLKYP